MDRETSSVNTAIIYNNIGQIIQQWSAETLFDLGGKINIPNSADTDTLLLFGESSEQHVLIPYTLNYPPSLFSASRRPLINVKKGTATYHGKFYANNNDNGNSRSISILVTAGDREKIITIYDYDMVEELGTNVDQMKTIQVIPLLDGIGTINNISMTYLVNHLSWSGYYTLLLDLTSLQIAVLRFNADAMNSRSLPFFARKTIFVAGKVNTSSSERVPMARLSFTQVAMTTTTESAIPLDEYVEYPYGPINVEPNASTPINLFTQTAIPCQKIYSAIFGQDGVTFGYRFVAPRTLPAGNVIVYSTGKMKEVIGPFIGSSSIPETRMGQDVDITMGSTTSLKITAIVSSSHCNIQSETEPMNEPIDDKKCRQTLLTAKLINTNDKTTFVILHYYIGESRILDNKITALDSVEWKMERKLNQLEFSGILPSSSETWLNVELIIGS